MSSQFEASKTYQATPAGLLEQIWEVLRRPLFAPFLRERKLAGILSGVAFIQLGLVLMGFNGWPCPIKAVLGIPCPGCGMSRALVLLLKGQFTESVQWHPFAPLFLAGIFLLFLATLLPSRWGQKLAQMIAAIERRTGLMAFLLLGLMLWWAARLLLM
jgi:hypothetical protein